MHLYLWNIKPHGTSVTHAFKTPVSTTVELPTGKTVLAHDLQPHLENPSTPLHRLKIFVWAI